ncbi:hypothetical protein PLESTF_001637000 [Pleodorina starrii]|nr:hypothetical protein PLESTF_001637000 [Pleodorina starrii]
MPPPPKGRPRGTVGNRAWHQDRRPAPPPYSSPPAANIAAAPEAAAAPDAAPDADAAADCDASSSSFSASLPPTTTTTRRAGLAGLYPGDMLRSTKGAIDNAARLLADLGSALPNHHRRIALGDAAAFRPRIRHVGAVAPVDPFVDAVGR